jgi:mannose-6-phosphate isomerase-like protein (cupin superfamily)
MERQSMTRNPTKWSILNRRTINAAMLLALLASFCTTCRPKKNMDPNEKQLPAKEDYLAPDGSEVRLLVSGERGNMAHFRLPDGKVSKPVAHRTIEELWYFTAGIGEFWRRIGTVEDVIKVSTGMSLRIPTGAAFQFRSLGPGPLEAIGISMPPWPGVDEAYAVDGKWKSPD